MIKSVNSSFRHHIQFFFACIVVLSAISHANAEWREDIGVFRIGIVTQGDIAGTLSRSEPFREAVAKTLDMDVEFFPASTATAVMDALKEDRIEYAMLSASAYALVSSICKCVEPLVIPRASDSSDAYHLVAISRFGENVSLDALDGKRIGILSSSAIVGEGLVRHLWSSEEGLNALETVEFQSEATSQATEIAFLNGDFDILLGWSSLNGDPADGFGRGTLQRLVRNSADRSVEYEVIWKSPAIPHRPHVVRTKLPGEVKNLLRDLMVNLFERNPVAYDSIEPVYGGGFSAARSGRFDVLRNFFESKQEKGAVNEPPPEVSREE